MNILGMRQRLADMVQEAGGAKALIAEYNKRCRKEHRIKSHSHISAIIRGDAKPKFKYLRLLRLKERVGDEGKKPQYEDITN